MQIAPKPRIECKASEGIDPLKLCPVVAHRAEIDGEALYENKYLLMQVGAKCWLMHKLLVECVNEFNRPVSAKEKSK